MPWAQFEIELQPPRCTTSVLSDIVDKLQHKQINTAFTCMRLYCAESTKKVVYGPAQDGVRSGQLTRLFLSHVFERGGFSLAVNKTQTTSKSHWQDKLNANSLKSGCSIPDMTKNCKVARPMPAFDHSGSLKRNDGGVEYFNTIVVQPHLKLVTNQGRGFHIRCRYQTKNRTISNNMNIREVAENVKIGDPLTLVISIDEQAAYGLRVSDCLVRDGLGWGEQRLINDEGCPLDGEIMGQFEYNESKTKASVHFQAHKFPYTASVYYQCNTPDDPNSICISQRNFAIAIAVAGLILMLAVVAVIVILLARRRTAQEGSLNNRQFNIQRTLHEYCVQSQ
uniref:ZP domain-containing protein n=1 Tax=Timema cristinae TaxID=61476 RepID=A0A7R9CB54_TIMCR|nr:unnamed protein product [Timema cristinae]